MKPNQVSPVVIQFKALPGIKLVAVNGNHCNKCVLCSNGEDGNKACVCEGKKPSGSCVEGSYHYEQA